MPPPVSAVAESRTGSGDLVAACAAGARRPPASPSYGGAYSAGYRQGWRGRPMRTPRHSAYELGFLAGAHRRALAERLGLYRPCAGIPAPPLPQRRAVRRALTLLGRELQRGVTWEAAVAQLGDWLPDRGA